MVLYTTNVLLWMIILLFPMDFNKNYNKKKKGTGADIFPYQLTYTFDI